MLSVGRALPVHGGTRAAAASHSAGATRLLRPAWGLSSNAPGATNTQGQVPPSGAGSAGPPSSGGGGGGAGTVLLGLTAVTGGSLVAYAKLPSFRSLVDDNIGPLPKPVMDVYNRLGLKIEGPADSKTGPAPTPPSQKGEISSQQNSSAGAPLSDADIDIVAGVDTTVESEEEFGAKEWAASAIQTVQKLDKEDAPASVSSETPSPDLAVAAEASPTTDMSSEAVEIEAAQPLAAKEAEGDAEKITAVPDVSVSSAKEEEGRDVTGEKDMEFREKMRMDLLKQAMETMDMQTAGVHVELDQSVLQGLEDLDAEGLRLRVVQLAVLMQDRMKGEVSRLMEGVKQVEEEAARKYQHLLSQQREEAEADLRAMLLAQREKLTMELTQMYSDRLREEIVDQANRFREAVKQKVMDGADAIREEADKLHQEEISTLKAKAAKEAEERIHELRELRGAVQRMAREMAVGREVERANAEVHRVSYAALSLAEKVGTSEPIKEELASLRELVGGDELVEAAVESIPEEAASRGIPTLSQLRNRFGTVKKECRRVSLIPEQAGTGVAGQIMASVLAAVTIAPKGLVEGSSTDDVLARASYLLEVGELSSAVQELETLEGRPALTVKDWLNDAKTRLVADQAMGVIRSHASLLSATHAMPTAT
ncbi:unnamed protein product [Discosporangium mesarthrocarpum]